MPVRYQTFPIMCRGGLVSNIARLQQGIEMPGSARMLDNFEPSIEGGYRRILGYTEVDSDFVPPYGTPRVNGGGQTGATVSLELFDAEPAIGDTFTIAGVSGTYEVTSVSYNDSLNLASLGITPDLDSSPADEAAVTFANNANPMLGVFYFNGRIMAKRGGTYWNLVGGTWTKVATPTSESTAKSRFTVTNITNTDTLIVTDEVNKPQEYDGTTWSEISDGPAGATQAIQFKQTMFYSVNNSLIFTAPFSYDDFSPATGAGELTVPDDVTGLIVFREQLFVFTETEIYVLKGNTQQDFQLSSVARDVGCIDRDTVQEVGGDVMFLSQDGVRFLSASERFGDFQFGVPSRPIQVNFLDFIQDYTAFTTVVVRGKNQYRIFGNGSSGEGFLGTQFSDQSSNTIAWSTLTGIYALVSCSVYTESNEEYLLFGNTDGKVYRMENGTTFNGTDIRAKYFTPYMAISDPLVRKTVYAATAYFKATTGIVGTLQVRFDFNEAGKLQPPQIQIDNDGGGVTWGSATWGSFTWGAEVSAVFRYPLVGSGTTVSLEFVFDGQEPFSLDTILIEYIDDDRY